MENVTHEDVESAYRNCGYIPKNKEYDSTIRYRTVYAFSGSMICCDLPKVHRDCMKAAICMIALLAGPRQ